MLASYRAVYDLTIDESDGEVASSATVSGRMVVEFFGAACSGYKNTMRILTQGEDSDGNSQVTDARTETLRPSTGATPSPTRPSSTMRSPRKR